MHTSATFGKYKALIAMGAATVAADSLLYVLAHWAWARARPWPWN